tara:strand:+ start:2883 stop:3425 length:543 start_codon:yes stop_codon:yes gene_type:complete
MMTISAEPKDVISCEFGRRAGNKEHLVVLYVLDTEERYAGETVLCTLAPSQRWILNLSPGDLVDVREKSFREGREEWLADAMPNNRQPSYDAVVQETSIQTTIETGLETSSPALAPEPLSGPRIETYIADPELFSIFNTLSSYDTKKEAGRLLLEYALKSLRPFCKIAEPSQIYDVLKNS